MLQLISHSKNKNFTHKVSYLAAINVKTRLYFFQTR